MKVTRLNLKSYYRKKGFTLIELLISIGLAAIVFLVSINLLKVTLKTVKVDENRTNFIQEAYFVNEYIKDEILSADKLIILDDLDSLGFIIVNEGSLKKDKPYHYITYYIERNVLYRKAFKSVREIDSSVNLREIKSYIGGKNKICSNITSVSGSGIDTNKNLVIIKYSMRFGNFEKNFSEQLALRAKVIQRGV